MCGVLDDCRVVCASLSADVEPWSTSGGQVPFVMQTFFRVAFVAQGLVCAGLIVSYKSFALYAALALAGLAVVAHTDRPSGKKKHKHGG